MKNIIKIVILVIGVILVIFGAWVIIDKSALTKEEIMQNINTIEINNNSISYANTFEDNVGVDILGNKDVFTSFETDTFGVSGLKVGSSIILTPAPDFIDTQAYHYYPDGKLALYISISNTVGGQVKYYFYNDKLIETKNELAEPGITPNLLDESDILTRAKAVYDRYAK